MTACMTYSMGRTGRDVRQTVETGRGSRYAGINRVELLVQAAVVVAACWKTVCSKKGFRR